MPSYYDEITLSPSVDNPRRLVFVATPGSPKLPEELLLLRQEYEQTARVVSVLFEDEKDARKELFLVLHVAADRGFRGGNFNIEDGRLNLLSTREIIVDAAHKARDRLLRQYTIILVLAGLLPLGLGFIVFFNKGFGFLDPTSTLFAWILAAIWIPAGAAVCVWGDFVLRMQAGLSYDRLLSMDPSRWRPVQRLIITIGISFIFAYLLAFNAVQVGVGGLLLNDFTKTPTLALAVGGTTGLAFAAVQDILFRIKPTTK